MGQPIPNNVGIFCIEYIDAESDTRRTETSQYPEEKRKTFIPQVAASERGTA